MMKYKILHLTINRPWFDLTAHGIKKIEFREIKMYWYKRLTNVDLPVDHPDKFLKFNEVHLRNGYSKNAPLLIMEHIKTDITPPKLITYSNGIKLHLQSSCYQIHLGKIIETINYDKIPINLNTKIYRL